MDSCTTSVSKGCFVFLPSESSKKRKRNHVNDCAVIYSQPWYKSYKKIWNHLKQQIRELNEDISSNLIRDVVTCVSKFQYEEGNIQTVALFTGINMPDHDTLFETLSSSLKEKLKCRVCVLTSSCSNTINSMIENMVCTFMSNNDTNVTDHDYSSDEESSSQAKSLKRSDCNLTSLTEWYNKLNNDRSCKPVSISLANRTTIDLKKPPLVIIIRDIEGHNSKVLENFLLILNIYSGRIPWVVIFGVSTTLSTIQNMLSHYVISKLSVHLFKSQPSVVFLNSMLEKIFLTSDCPFKIGGKVFNYLTDMFLFYNFSVTGFVRGIQFSLMDHFYYSNLSCLCTRSSCVSSAVSSLVEKQLQEVYELPSMVSYIELRRKNGFPSLSKPSDMKEEIEKLLNELHIHIQRFHTAIRSLNSLVKSLPQVPLGKYVREIYAEAMSTHLADTTKFKACFALIDCISKEELLEKLDTITTIFESHEDDLLIAEIVQMLKILRNRTSAADLTKIVRNSEDIPQELDLHASSRSQLRMKLLDNVQREKLLTEYEKVRKEVIAYLVTEVFKPLMKPPSNLPLHEVLIYNDVYMIRTHIDGIPRSVLHTALKNPQHYLKCKCCSLAENNEILRSMPDVCVAYKLHLECGTLINLYDWLQSFAAFTNPDDENDTQVNPEVQSRFSHAVAELQFLGFVRPTKRKLDHVERLTFDGS